MAGELDLVIRGGTVVDGTDGMPFEADPASTLNSASTDNVTSPGPCMCGVAFNERPRSSKVKDGGGV